MTTLTTIHSPRIFGNRMIDELVKDWMGQNSIWEDSGTPVSFPRVDVKESVDSLQIVAEIPGMRREDIKVMVEDDVLSISGERKFEHEEKKEGFLRREISRGSFIRSFVLPETVIGEKLDANYKDGFLTLFIPKREEVKPKQVEVKVK